MFYVIGSDIVNILEETPRQHAIKITTQKSSRIGFNKIGRRYELKITKTASASSVSDFFQIDIKRLLRGTLRI